MYRTTLAALALLATAAAAQAGEPGKRGWPLTTPEGAPCATVETDGDAAACLPRSYGHSSRAPLPMGVDRAMVRRAWAQRDALASSPEAQAAK